MEKEPIAIVDVGSHTIRTCIYRIKPGNKGFKKIVDVNKSVGLAGYVENSGMMSVEGIELACRTVSKMVRVAELVGVGKTIILATAAIRNCENTNDIVATMSKKAGHRVRVLSGEEEALMSTVGASWATGIGTGLFFDLGGGSTELTVLSRGKLVALDSVPVGSLSSWKRGEGTIVPGAEEIEAIEEGFTLLTGASHVNLSASSTVVGVGGSMRLALKVASSLSDEDRKGIVRLSDLNRILDMGVSETAALCRLVLKLKPGRIHTFLPACAIARSILLSVGCDEMTVAKAGLREGCLLTELKASPIGLCKDLTLM